MSKKKNVAQSAPVQGLQIFGKDRLKYQLGVFAVLAAMFALRFFPIGDYNFSLISTYLLSAFRGFYVNFLGGTLLDIFAGTTLAAVVTAALTALALTCAAVSVLIGNALYLAQKDSKIALPLGLFAGFAVAAPSSFTVFFAKDAQGYTDVPVIFLLLCAVLCLCRPKVRWLGCVLAVLAAAAGFISAFSYLPMFAAVVLFALCPSGKNGGAGKKYGYIAVGCLAAAVLACEIAASASSFYAINTNFYMISQNSADFLFSSDYITSASSGSLFSYFGYLSAQTGVPKAMLVCMVINLPILVLFPVFWVRAVTNCKKLGENRAVFILPLLSPLFALPSLIRFASPAQFFLELVIAQVLAVFILYLMGSKAVRVNFAEMWIFRPENLVFSLMCIVYMLSFYARFTDYLGGRGQRFFDLIPF